MPFRSRKFKRSSRKPRKSHSRKQKFSTRRRRGGMDENMGETPKKPRRLTSRELEELSRQEFERKRQEKERLLQELRLKDQIEKQQEIQRADYDERERGATPQELYHLMPKRDDPYFKKGKIGSRLPQERMEQIMPSPYPLLMPWQLPERPPMTEELRHLHERRREILKSLEDARSSRFTSTSEAELAAIDQEIREKTPVVTRPPVADVAYNRQRLASSRNYLTQQNIEKVAGPQGKKGFGDYGNYLI
jgi:hypothetical protein